MLVHDRIIASVSTPDVVVTPLGLLEFRYGAPSPATAETVFDNLTFMRGVDAFLNGLPIASIRATGDSPAMCMRIPGIGSQYVWATVDADGADLDGAGHYTLTLPEGIPAARFWSLTVYDNATRSMLQTPQRYPRAGSQSYPTPAAEPEPDGSTVIHFSPGCPDGVASGNWIQTVRGKGWNVILRLYSPGQAFFDKTWRPGEIERIASA